MKAIEARQRYLRRALYVCLILSAVVVSFYLSHTDLAQVWRALGRLDPLFLLLGLATVLASWVVEGLRVYLIADALDERISVWRLIRINIATAFSGNVVPMASMAAPPTQVFLLHREGVPVGKATAIVALRTAASTLFFTTAALLLFLGFGRTFAQAITTNIAISALIQIVLIASAFVAFTTLVILIRPQLGVRLTSAALALRLTQRLLGRRSEEIGERVAREAQDFHLSMVSLFKNKMDAVLIVLLTLVYWVLYFSVAPLLLLGVGFGLTFRRTARLFVFLFLTYFFLSYLPIPTGSGVSELGFGSILLFFGLPDPVRTVILVVWSFLCVQIYTLLGGAFFFGYLRKRKKVAGGGDKKT